MAEKPAELTETQASGAGHLPAPECFSTIPKAAEAFANNARDLEALRATVVEAANVGAGLWFSYISAVLYLFVAVGSVTHKDLFFESPIKLPFLSIELPLLGFFALGPLLLLIVHGYVLLHLALLTDKVGKFNAALDEQLVNYPSIRAELRRQLPSNLFVQVLAAPRDVHENTIGILMRLIAWISLVAGPIILLTFFLLQFLPFHHPWLTWWHRIAIVADLALLWLLRPSIALGRLIPWQSIPRLLRWSRPAQAMAVLSLLLLILVFPVATYPGEALHRLPSVRFIPTGLYEIFIKLENLSWKSPHELLIDSEIDNISRKPNSLWSNRIVLPGLDVLDHTKFDTEAKIAALPETASLRGRQLERAILIDAKLRKVDFTGANLKEAILTSSDLRESKFECNYSTSTIYTCAQLQDSRLEGSKLQGASLKGAQLQGALLVNAQLQGAYLDFAQFQGADLTLAQLQGASLVGSQLQGADLTTTHFEAALLQGTSLAGSVAHHANFRGSSFNKAQLFGVDFLGAIFGGTSFIDVHVWGSDIRRSNRYMINSRQIFHDKISNEVFLEIKNIIEINISNKNARTRALERIKIIDPNIPRHPLAFLAMERAWLNDDLNQFKLRQFREIVQKVWRREFCDPDSSPYVLRALLKQIKGHGANLYFAAITEDDEKQFVKNLNEILKALFRKNCAASYHMSESEKIYLLSRLPEGSLGESDFSMNKLFGVLSRLARALAIGHQSP